MDSATNSVNTALLLVDIQNDFCEDGTLAVPGSNAILPVVNQWIERAGEKAWPTIASRDWHPVDHISFQERGGPWPDHCIQDTPGAAFHPDLSLPDDAIRVSKATAFEQDAYSAFDGTQLDAFLRRRNIQYLMVAGLALDVCVRASVRDALTLGFDVTLITDGTRAMQNGSAPNVFEELQAAGAQLV